MFLEKVLLILLIVIFSSPLYYEKRVKKSPAWNFFDPFFSPPPPRSCFPGKGIWLNIKTSDTTSAKISHANYKQWIIQ